MGWFCKHNWVILSETLTQSKLEHIRETIDRPLTKLKAPYEYTTRKFIQILSCPNCGKLKRFVEKV